MSPFMMLAMAMIALVVAGNTSYRVYESFREREFSYCLGFVVITIMLLTAAFMCLGEVGR